MILTPRKIALLVVAAAVLMPATAQAQWYSSAPSQPPLYPYAPQPNQPYAVQVAPNTYVIQRPGEQRQRPHARNNNAGPATTGHVSRSKVDPELVEELRSGRKAKTPVINTTQVVRGKPIVIETKRYVDDPPRVIERYTVADDKPAPAKNKRVAIAVDDAPIVDKRKGKSTGKDDEKRVINAEAEITILGPDRMSIRLFRKGDGSKAKASVE
jgi:hypothetical protein